MPYKFLRNSDYLIVFVQNLLLKLKRILMLDEQVEDSFILSIFGYRYRYKYVPTFVGQKRARNNVCLRKKFVKKS